jgi:hypothetical protein
MSIQAISGTANPYVPNTQASTSGIGADFQALAAALKTGNTSAAQDAFAKLTQDMQASGKTHRHHHHGGQAPVDSTTSTTPATGVTGSTDSSGNTTPGVGGINLLL